MNVLTAQALGPTGRGEVAYVLQVGYLLAPFLLLGADRSLLREGGSYQRSLPDLRASGLLAVIVAAAFVSAALLGFGANLWLSVPAAFMGVVIAATRAKGIAARRPSQFLRLTAGYQLFILGTTTVIFVSGSESIPLWIGAYSIPGAAALVLVLLHGLWRSRESIKRQLVDREALRLLPGSLATIVVTRGERLALPILASTYQLGLYMVVATATELVAWGGQAVADIFVRASGKDDARLRRRIWAIGGVAAVGTTTLVGITLWFAIVPLFGSEFEAAKRLVPPLCVAALALSAYRLLIAALLGSDRPARSSHVELATAIIAIPTYTAAVYGFGAMGAAVASVAVYLVGCLLALNALRSGPNDAEPRNAR